MARHLPPGLIGTPAIEMMWTRAVTALMALSQNAPPGSWWRLALGFTTLAAKRNGLVEECLEQPHSEWLLFVDSDMLPPPDTVPRLLSHDVDIVGGLYVSRYPPLKAEAGHLTGTLSAPEDPLKPTEVPEFPYKELDLETEITGGLVEVDFIGAGCLLIRRHVLEAVGSPWFVQNDGRYNAHTSGEAEDFNFIARAKTAGFRVYCDTGLHCGHLAGWPITPSFARHVPREAYLSHGQTVSPSRGGDQRNPSVPSSARCGPPGR